MSQIYHRLTYSFYHSPFAIYLATMLSAIFIRTYFFETISVVWIINFIGLGWFFRNNLLHPTKNILWICTLYIFSAIGTLAVNTELLEWGPKAVGTNLNTLAVCMFWVICNSQIKMQFWTISTIEAFCKFLSVLGLITILYAWVADSASVLSIMRGASAYSIKTYGFFYSKNIYGAFVALTIIADLLLYQEKGRFKYLFFSGVKIVAVVLSFSRAALLLGISIYAFTALLSLRQKNILKLVIIFAFLGLCVGLFILSHESAMQFMINQVFRVEVGDAGRTFLRQMALDKFGSSLWHILFGVGYFGIDFLDIDIDNTYFYLLFSGGILKVFIYVVAYIISIKRILQLRRHNMILGNLCLSVSVSYLLFAYFESVALFELGLLNFLFGIWMYIIPFGWDSEKNN